MLINTSVVRRPTPPAGHGVFPPVRGRGAAGRAPTDRRNARRAIARSWIASPVESKSVVSASSRRPSASPARTAPSVVTSSRVTSPAATAAVSSPPWLACSQSSQKSRPRASSSTATSAFPGPSAPISDTCWPGRRDPGPYSTSWPGVTVITASHLRACSSESATRPPTASATLARRPGSTSQRIGATPRAPSIRAVSAPFAPQPTTATDDVAAASVSTASTAAAAVRSAVTAAPSSTASSAPVSAFERRTRPVTVGSPRARLPGERRHPLEERVAAAEGRHRAEIARRVVRHVDLRRHRPVATMVGDERVTDGVVRVLRRDGGEHRRARDDRHRHSRTAWVRGRAGLPVTGARLAMKVAPARRGGHLHDSSWVSSGTEPLRRCCRS